MLEKEGFEVLFPKTKKEAVELIQSGNFDLLLVSYSLSSDTIEEMAELARQRCPRCPVVSISQTGWDDARIKPDATVVADEGPRPMVTAIREVLSRGAAQDQVACVSSRSHLVDERAARLVERNAAANHHSTRDPACAAL